jgi:hypothetical protein
VEADLALARYAIATEPAVVVVAEDGETLQPRLDPAASPQWHEQSSGILWTGDGTESDAWYGTWAMGDSRLTRFIAANDPQAVIARCEAELAILDLYEQQVAKASENAMEEDRAWTLAPVIALLASGYRHRKGYREENWK